MALFEILVILASIIVYYILQLKDKSLWKKFTITFVGVLLFEYFTQALWFNKNLESWAYLYLDVSWIITLGWTFIILASIAIIDSFCNKYSEKKRYVFSILLASAVGFIAEALVRNIGIREYAARTQEFLSGVQLLSVPIEAFYYIPVFMALIIAFKKYWEINYLGGRK